MSWPILFLEVQWCVPLSAWEEATDSVSPSQPFLFLLGLLSIPRGGPQGDWDVWGDRALSPQVHQVQLSDHPFRGSLRQGFAVVLVDTYFVELTQLCRASKLSARWFQPALPLVQWGCWKTPPPSPSARKTCQNLQTWTLSHLKGRWEVGRRKGRAGVALLDKCQVLHIGGRQREGVLGEGASSLCILPCPGEVGRVQEGERAFLFRVQSQPFIVALVTFWYTGLLLVRRTPRVVSSQAVVETFFNVSFVLYLKECFISFDWCYHGRGNTIVRLIIFFFSFHQVIGTASAVAPSPASILAHSQGGLARHWAGLLPISLSHSSSLYNQSL